LLDNHRADLVGEKTFGEGTLQKTFELPDGAALILSVAKYESPNGSKLQDDGVTPGVMVASNIPDEDGAEEAAAEEEHVPTAAHEAPAAKPTVSVDEQLNKALDLLKNKAA
jgi:carboxyl-terminal processing protease